MRDELILLASSHTPRNVGGIDKQLAGYSTIQYVRRIEGGIFLSYDADEVELTEGEWFFPAHPGPRIRFHPLYGGHWEHRHVGFQGPLVERWRAEGLWPERAQPAPLGRNWPDLFDELIGLFRRFDRVGRMRAVNKLEQLLLELAEARAEAGREREGGDAWLESVLARLDARTEPDLARLAPELGLSSTALRRRFKAATGISLQEHVLQSRIAAARALLTDTDLPLKAVAHQLGYQNEFFFSRQFKEKTGAAPGAFRKSRQLN